MNAPVFIQRMACIQGGSEPDYKALIPNPALRRRMSRIVKMGVAAALECIAHTPTDDIEAIVTATGLGCLADTEKFMNSLCDNNEQLLNPTAFIQSTFNTVGAQIALWCKNQSYNMTYVHRGLSFESALLDAVLRLYEGDKLVLVGAFDEVTETSFRVQTRMGLYRDATPGEGSQFFLLAGERNEDTLAAVYAPYTFTGQTTPAERDEHIQCYLQQCGLNRNDIDLVDTSAIKRTYGECPTASAFALWDAVQGMAGRDKGVMLYNDWYGASGSLIMILP